MRLSNLILVLIIIAVAMQSCNEEGSSQDTQNQKLSGITEIEFTETSIDFGKINAGEIVSHKFKFKNTGENPLQIADVRTTCGCTATEFSQQPIAPGETGFVMVSFDSTNRTGNNFKEVSVVANTKPALTRLKLYALVEPPTKLE